MNHPCAGTLAALGPRRTWPMRALSARMANQNLKSSDPFGVQTGRHANRCGSAAHMTCVKMRARLSQLLMNLVKSLPDVDAWPVNQMQPTGGKNSQRCSWTARALQHESFKRAPPAQGCGMQLGTMQVVEDCD